MIPISRTVKLLHDPLLNDILEYFPGLLEMAHLSRGEGIENIFVSYEPRFRNGFLEYEPGPTWHCNPHDNRGDVSYLDIDSEGYVALRDSDAEEVGVATWIETPRELREFLNFLRSSDFIDWIFTEVEDLALSKLVVAYDLQWLEDIPWLSEARSHPTSVATLPAGSSKDCGIKNDDIIISHNAEVTRGVDYRYPYTAGEKLPQQAIVLRPKSTCSSAWIYDFFADQSRSSQCIEALLAGHEQLPQTLKQTPIQGFDNKFKQIADTIERREQERSQFL